MENFGKNGGKKVKKIFWKFLGNMDYCGYMCYTDIKYIL